MHRNTVEKLAEIVLGEAALKLLDGSTDIRYKSLISELKKMAACEADPDRRKACEKAVSDLEKAAAAGVPARLRERVLTTPDSLLLSERNHDEEDLH